MKKFLSVCISLILIAILAACTAKGGEVMSDMEKIQKQFLEMKNYACIATVEHISKRGTKSYETKQYYKKTGEYRLEMLAPENIKGIITTYNGKTICQYNPNVESKIRKDLESSEYVDEMFLGAFIENYLKSEETSIAVSKFDKAKCTILEAVIPGNHKYLSTEKLWVDNETLLPKQLVIYDKDGSERIRVTYGEFQWNVELEDKIFNISKED